MNLKLAMIGFADAFANLNSTVFYSRLSDKTVTVMAEFWCKILREIGTVDHKFLVLGHSFSPSDRDFAVMEPSSRKLLTFLHLKTVFKCK